MNKRVIPAAIQAFLAVFFALALFGCGVASRRPEKMSFHGLVLTLWDSPEPAFQGVDSYDKLVISAVEKFCAEHKVRVDVEFRERREILEFLMGQKPQEPSPSVVYSTEWPVAPDSAQNLDKILDDDGYLEGAIRYWTKEDGLFGVPSYFHWVGMAAKSPPDPGGELPRDSACWPDSQWFLPAALDLPEAGFVSEKVAEYLRWLKVSCSPEAGDPLDEWRRGSVSALFPVTPHLYKWLRTTYGDGVFLCPMPGPFGNPRFYCTVPGYVVVAETEPEESCALLLAQELAAARGRWAARNIGVVPAAIVDMPVYDLHGESSGYDKFALRSLESEIFVSVPRASEALMREKVSAGVADLVQSFMKGNFSVTDMERGILNLWESHTKP